MRVRQLSRAEAETILGKLEPERARRLRVRPAPIRFVADEKARWLEELCCVNFARHNLYRLRSNQPLPHPLA
jgi:hypothetical protein